MFLSFPVASIALFATPAILAPESVLCLQVTMPTAADRVDLSRVVFNPSGLSVNYSHIHRALK